MRIVEVRERTVPMAASMTNAFVSFARMTASTVAIVSDVVRDAAPLVGFGFNSNGRYAQKGLLEERFIPRLQLADPQSLLDPGPEPVRRDVAPQHFLDHPVDREPPLVLERNH